MNDGNQDNPGAFKVTCENVSNEADFTQLNIFSYLYFSDSTQLYMFQRLHRPGCLASEGGGQVGGESWHQRVVVEVHVFLEELP